LNQPTIFVPSADPIFGHFRQNVWTAGPDFINGRAPVTS